MLDLIKYLKLFKLLLIYKFTNLKQIQIKQKKSRLASGSDYIILEIMLFQQQFHKVIQLLHLCVI